MNRIVGRVVRNARHGTWNFCFKTEQGKSTSRKLGSFAELPTREAADRRAVALGYELRFRALAVPTVEELAVLYQKERMPERHSTRRIYLIWMRKYILPTWGKSLITEVKARPAQKWLDSLPLAPKTKGHLRAILHSLWDYAKFCEMVPSQENPISLVHLKGVSKRQKQPRSLSEAEFIALIAQLREPFKTMAILQLCLGLRCSELLALKWSDIDWLQSTISIQRGIVNQIVAPTKTPGSEQVKTLGSGVIAMLQSWKQQTQFPDATDWLFPSPAKLGRLPYSDGGYRLEVQAAARRAGIEPIGTHSFRASSRSWLAKEGVPLETQQRFMRHSDLRTTLSYGTPVDDSLAAAHTKLDKLAFN